MQNRHAIVDISKGDLLMAANSVSGSFRGIEVSFTYSGPHIVMSVLNTGDDGRKLRVMYQQQPHSGRVNWTSFQLTGFPQDVVVPQEVIHSHKLAFYVDTHEPIATYTEKILEELKQVLGDHTFESDEIESDPNQNDQTLEPTDEKPIVIEQPDINIKNSNEKIEIPQQQRLNEGHTSDTNINQSVSDHNGNIPSEDTLNSVRDHTNTHTNAATNNLPNNFETNVNANEIQTNNSSKSQSNNGTAENTINTEQLKWKGQNIGQYIPDVNTELKFKIKVPSIPKSASNKQTTFIPPRTSSRSITNSKKNGFFGQLAGAIGLSFLGNKKQYYMQQNQQLHEKFHADLERLESNYNDGNGIPLDNWDLESLTEQQTAILLLNLMVSEISEWKGEAKKSNKTKDTLAETLQTIEDELKQTLKQTRGIDAPAPTLFPDRTASTDQDLVHIQNDCDSYLQRFSKKLVTLEEKHAEKVRISAFKKFLLEFVRDKLFPSVAEYSSLKSVQSRLNWFLSLIDYEMIPIELGKTKFSPQFHEVKEKRRCEFESETIVEVVSPGLQLKGGKRIIQNAVVIQAE